MTLPGPGVNDASLEPDIGELVQPRVLASAGSHVVATAAIDRVSCGAQIRHFSEITERQILVFRVNNLHQEIERAA